MLEQARHVAEVGADRVRGQVALGGEVALVGGERGAIGSGSTSRAGASSAGESPIRPL